MEIRQPAKLVAAIAICEIAGFIGSLFSGPGIASWYSTLNKPSFTPPDWVFMPVWIVLYFFMGIALYLVWEKGLKDKKIEKAIFIFAVQLALNVAWSYAFFGLQSPLYGLVIIGVLWGTIVETILKFRPISNTAGLLLLPYILWVSFALVLNFSIWMLNPGLG
ncbi:TPA: tryptophan-rich sensory protein [Candidatus Micrarchaeota archaeon]|nr:tryptophan-rich sensory protein [Candidatus Micrarchaeota archaeon]